MSDRDHSRWLEFVRNSMALPIEYSVADLEKFRAIADNQYPALVRVIDAYLNLIRQSVRGSKSSRKTPASSNRDNQDADGEVPLLDMLRDARIFPRNKDISMFAQKILPNMRTYRFDKMSKSDVALRIIEYLETLPPKTRAKLESSMRDALELKPEQAVQRSSFVSKWEQIIKGIELG